jgi:hypothetical protein
MLVSVGFRSPQATSPCANRDAMAAQPDAACKFVVSRSPSAVIAQPEVAGHRCSLLIFAPLQRVS